MYLFFFFGVIYLQLLNHAGWSALSAHTQTKAGGHVAYHTSSLKKKDLPAWRKQNGFSLLVCRHAYTCRSLPTHGESFRAYLQST